MKFVNCWLGRNLAPPLLAVLLLATLPQASRGMEPTWTQSSPALPASALSNQATAQQTTPQDQSPAQSAQPQDAGQSPQGTPTQSTPARQTPVPVVRQSAPGSGQSTNPPADQVVPSPQDQQYNRDQQYSTPAANQQLAPAGRRPLTSPAGASLPAAPPAPPVGTAVAPVIVSTGTAGSRVAGAAVAPAKQRRIRVFVIRAALVVGAAVAIGTVIGASKASPARAQ